MKKTSNKLSEEFKNEIDLISSNTILDASYRKKKLILWLIRTLIAIVFYIIFWKHNWVKISLYVSVPLSIFSLFSIIVLPYFLKKKMSRTQKNIVDLEEAMNEDGN